MSSVASVADLSALIVSRAAVTLRSVLATSWKAPGLVRDAWLRLDVAKGHREELARLTGIPAPNLSGFNTGRRPLTMEMAQRIVAAVPGLTLADLGAPAAEPENPSFPDRLATLEAEVAETKAALDLARESYAVLLERVEALEAAPRRGRARAAAPTRGRGAK